MKLIKQPNSWSCTVAAAAMVLDCEIKEIIDYVDHDGSEIILPNLKPPGCYKGFHIQEIIDVVLLMGYTMTPIEARPVQTPTGYHEFEINKWGQFKSSEDRFHYHLTRENGLLIGKAREYWHTVAWDSSTWRVFDPQGRIYNLDDCKIAIAQFWLIKSLGKN